MYLDEVSVYSLLASLRGAIDAEFTESQTASLNSEIRGSMGGGFGVAKAEISSRLDSGQSRTSQVVRKAIVQTSFRQVHQLVEPNLALTPSAPDKGLPNLHAWSDAERSRDELKESGWIVDLGELRRGAIVEVDVTLTADPIFHVSAIITTIRDVMEENQVLFGSDNVAQLAEMRSVGQMIESLLAGLVPVRGRLVDYRAVEIGGREYLARSEILDRLAPEDCPLTRDVVVVGVAERDLFWKDIRRVLFADGRFTLFCRLAGDGLQDRWRPVKAMELLGEVHPFFGEQMGRLGETTLNAMEAAVDATQARETGEDVQEYSLLERYCSLLAESHDRELDAESIRSIIESLDLDPEWTKSVDGRRPVLTEVARRVDERLGVTTSRDIASNLRVVAHFEGDFGSDDSKPEHLGDGTGSADYRPRYIDSEIVAVYW